MSVEVIQCPACEHQLRVPESLFGEPVTCPQCRITFRAPERQYDGSMGLPTVLRTQSSAAPSKPKFLLPGLVILLVGSMGLLCNGWIAFKLFADPDMVIDQYMENLKDPAFKKMVGDQEFTREQLSEGMVRLRMVCIVLAFLSSIVAAGGVGMLAQRFYWLAVLASGIAVINPPLCCLGFPAGIFGLVKLLDPEARACFRP